MTSTLNRQAHCPWPADRRAGAWSSIEHHGIAQAHERLSTPAQSPQQEGGAQQGEECARRDCGGLSQIAATTLVSQPRSVARVGRARVPAAVEAAGLGRDQVSSAIRAAGVRRDRISSAIGAAAGATGIPQSTAGAAAASTRTSRAACDRPARPTCATSPPCAARNHATRTSRAACARPTRSTCAATSARSPRGASAQAARAAAAAAKTTRTASAAATAVRRVDVYYARAGAIARYAGPAGRSVLRIVASPRAVAGRAASAAAQAAFLLWIAAGGVGRAFASLTGPIARHADSIARALATHPIHAEARGASARAGAGCAVLGIATAAGPARLSRAATRNFGARSRHGAGALVAGNVA